VAKKPLFPTLISRFCLTTKPFFSAGRVPPPPREDVLLDEVIVVFSGACLLYSDKQFPIFPHAGTSSAPGRFFADKDLPGLHPLFSSSNPCDIRPVAVVTLATGDRAGSCMFFFFFFSRATLPTLALLQDVRRSRAVSLRGRFCEGVGRAVFKFLLRPVL